MTSKQIGSARQRIRGFSVSARTILVIGDARGFSFQFSVFSFQFSVFSAPVLLVWSHRAVPPEYSTLLCASTFSNLARAATPHRLRRTNPRSGTGHMI